MIKEGKTKFGKLYECYDIMVDQVKISKEKRMFVSSEANRKFRLEIKDFMPLDGDKLKRTLQRYEAELNEEVEKL